MPEIPSGVGIWWPASHSSIPSGWERNTDFDTRFAKSQSSTSNPNGTGGASSHVHGAGGNHTHTVAGHTHTGTTGNNSAVGQLSGSNYHAMAGVTHTHDYTMPSQTGSLNTDGGSWQTQSHEPGSHLAIYIESDGTGDGFPAGCVVYWNTSSAPSGWSQHSGTTGKLIRGAVASSGNGGSDAGSTNHTHTANSHSHVGASHQHGGGTTGNSSSTRLGYTPSGYSSYVVADGGHTFTPANDINDSSVQSVAGGASGNANNTEPPYYKMGNITPSSDGWLENATCMWLGTLGNIPEDWTHMNTNSGSGEGATIDLRDKFIKSADSSLANIGSTGGSAGHSHSAPGGHTHTASHKHEIPTVSAAGSNNTGHSWYAQAAAKLHTHSGGTSTATAPLSNSQAEIAPANTADTQPLFRTVAYIRSPEEPAGGNMAMFGANF